MLPRPSCLSVSNSPEGRLRHRCSSRYLRISPLHREFRLPLLSSSPVVSDAVSPLSGEISHPTHGTAYAPFTPSKSEQRSTPLYYRGCWHRVSRVFLLRYYQEPTVLGRIRCSLTTAVYNPKAFVLHATSLDHAFAHCPRPSTAASRRSLGSVSVPVWLTILSDQLPVIALVGHYPANKLIGHELIPKRQALRSPALDSPACAGRPHSVLPRLSADYSQLGGRLPMHYSPVRRYRSIVLLP